MTGSAGKVDSASTQFATEEKVQRPAGRSSRATDAESRKGRKGKKAKRDDKDADSEGDKAQEQAEKESQSPRLNMETTGYAVLSVEIQRRVSHLLQARHSPEAGD
jgi:hypothetical protein